MPTIAGLLTSASTLPHHQAHEHKKTTAKCAYPHAHHRRVADLNLHTGHLSTHPLHGAAGRRLALGRRLCRVPGGVENGPQLVRKQM